MRIAWCLIAAFAVGLVAGESVSQEKKRPPAGDTSKDIASALRFARNPFQVPETDDVDELVAFTQKLLQYEANSEDEAKAYTEKGPTALRQASERILELEKDTSSKNWRTAKAIVLNLDSGLVNDPDAGVNKRKLFAEVREFVEDSNLGLMEFQVAQRMCNRFEYSGDPQLAAEAYSTFGDIFAKSETRQVANLSKRLTGGARRMNLIGNELELKGETFDGKKFDIRDLRGKVVLVDFWATWCGPCREEHPNISKNFKKYRDKGFAVVGISLDEDREALGEFLEEHEMLWPTLHHHENGSQHPAAEYYGIFGIPAMMLVDQEGKVLTLNARGDRLGEELERLLGPAE